MPSVYGRTLVGDYQEGIWEEGKGEAPVFGCKPGLLDNNFQTRKNCEQNSASIGLEKH